MEGLRFTRKHLGTFQEFDELPTDISGIWNKKPKAERMSGDK